MKIKEVVLSLSVFLIVYVITSYFIGVKNITFEPDKYQDHLNKYIQNHQEELEGKVFNIIFDKAKLCLEIPNLSIKAQCQQEIGIDLGKVILEEEMSDNYSWPDDLFFVKQVDDKYYSLGWGGVLEDITDSVNKPLKDSPRIYLLETFTGNCRVFKAVLPELNDCQVISSFSLDNNSKGYLVRRFLYGEELLFFWFSPLIPVFTTFSYFYRDYSIPLDEYELQFYLFSIIPFITGFLSILVLALYRKYKSKNL